MLTFTALSRRMSRKKRLVGAILLLLFSALLNVGSHLYVRRHGYLLHFTQGVASRLQGHSLGGVAAITVAQADEARMPHLRGAFWRDCVVEVRLTDRAQPEDWRVAAQSVGAEWTGWASGQIEFVARKLTVSQRNGGAIGAVRRNGTTRAATGFRFLADRFRLQLPVQELWRDSGAGAIRHLARAAAAWLDGDPASLDLEFAGVAEFQAGGHACRLTVFTEEVKGGVLLRADPTDVRVTAARMRTYLTQAEADLLSRYPLRILQLVEIMQSSEELSNEAFPERRGLRDAYRHVVWNYLLCEAFGEEFADQVTEAHEVGGHNVTRERERDHRNNALGRKYWREGVPFTELIDRVRRDRRVEAHDIHAR